MTELTERWKRYFEWQAEVCRRDGSPLYSELLGHVSRSHEDGGIVAEILSDWNGDPLLTAVSLRLMGAIHLRVLEGRLPELAHHYPSMGGTPRYPDVGQTFLRALETERDFVRGKLDQQLQTNEVGRSAALLGGFLEVAKGRRLPLRLLEVGVSAGLNHVWDHYRYEFERTDSNAIYRWGKNGERPTLRTRWSGPAPALDAPVQVAARSGCDLSPIDLGDYRRQLQLESFIWPDQLERLERLRAAAEVVRRVKLNVEQESALPWLEKSLSQKTPGWATVVFHSVVWLYIPHDERQTIEALMKTRGAEATESAPLAWLQMEAQSDTDCAIRLREWPGNEDRVLGLCGFHGQAVRWHGTAAGAP